MTTEHQQATQPGGHTKPKAMPKSTQGHTPGPWQIAEYGIAEAKAKYLCVKKGGKTICRIDAQGNSLSTNEQDERNARLIAAAPDLLAALKLSETDLRLAFNTRKDSYGYSKGLEAVVAAIAKAQP